MEKVINDKFEKPINRSFKTIIVLYLFVGLYYFLSLPSGGDETLFIEDLQLIRNMGWIAAICKCISIPYMILAYPLSFIFKEYIALRLVNIILLIGFFSYLKSQVKDKNSLVFYYLLFFFSTVGICYFATNDFLFDISLVVFFNETYKTTLNKKSNINIALTALVIAFFTRQLFFVYIPVILLSLYIYNKKGFKINTYTLVPAIVFLLFIIINIPSLEKNHTLSWDNKTPPKNVKSTWTQRQYLAQLLVNENKLEDKKHPSWDETDKYIEIHGSNSLPDGIINGMLFDLKLTIKEFFKDFYYCIVYQTRSLGLVFFISLFYLLVAIWKRKFNLFDYFIPLATLIMLLIFSLIIISYVELRWLQPVFIMLLIYFADLHKKINIPKYLLNSNVLLISLLSIYGIVRIINKL